MPLGPGKAVNLTQISERLPRAEGPRQAIHVLERGGGPIFEIIARDGAADWPDEPGECDAIYVIISGEGVLHHGNEALECAVGDVLFAPAGAPRRFEALGRGFATWRILLGTT